MGNTRSKTQRITDLDRFESIERRIHSLSDQILDLRNLQSGHTYNPRQWKSLDTHQPVPPSSREEQLGFDHHWPKGLTA